MSDEGMAGKLYQGGSQPLMCKKSGFARLLRLSRDFIHLLGYFRVLPAVYLEIAHFTTTRTPVLMAVDLFVYAFSPGR